VTNERPTDELWTGDALDQLLKALGIPPEAFGYTVTAEEERDGRRVILSISAYRLWPTVTFTTHDLDEPHAPRKATP
jgi:cobalamin biosynthesis protein CbiG